MSVDKSREIVEDLLEKVKSGKYEVSISCKVKNEDVWVLKPSGKKKLETNGTLFFDIRLREKKEGELGLIDAELIETEA